jgi:hypothetical protein
MEGRAAQEERGADAVTAETRSYDGHMRLEIVIEGYRDGEAPSTSAADDGVSQLGGRHDPIVADQVTEMSFEPLGRDGRDEVPARLSGPISNEVIGQSHTSSRVRPPKGVPEDECGESSMKHSHIGVRPPGTVGSEGGESSAYPEGRPPVVSGYPC